MFCHVFINRGQKLSSTGKGKFIGNWLQLFSTKNKIPVFCKKCKLNEKVDCYRQRK